MIKYAKKEERYMKIELRLMSPFEDDDEFNQSYDFEIGPFEDDKFQLTIFYNKDKSLKEQVQDRNRLEKKNQFIK